MDIATTEIEISRLESYRWPAEWEAHAATWLSWPHNRETWPTAFAAAEQAFVEIVAALTPGERVRIGGLGALMDRVKALLATAGVPLERVDCATYPTADAWVRDHGPVFLSSAEASPIALDFEFDNWGQKYPGWELDNSVPARIAIHLNLARLPVPFVLEGGSVDGDGRGTVLTTESCLLHPSRSHGGTLRTQASCEAILARYLRSERVIWLAGGIEGDDTDGHIDDVARFVAPGRIVAVRSRRRGDPDFSVLEENWRRLGDARDALGARIERVELPVPPRIAIDGVRLPASYANFYLANAVALVPTYGVSSDETALRILEEALPGRRIVPVRCESLVEGLGAIHCCTKEEPRGTQSNQDEL